MPNISSVFGRNQSQKHKADLLSMDLFGKSVQSFNIGGQQTVYSGLGFFMTIILVCMMCLFLTTNLDKLINRLDANVSQANITDFFDVNTKVSIDPAKTASIPFEKTRFKVAFAAVHYVTRENKIDPEYTRWLVHIEKIEFNKTVRIPLKVHACTQEDFDEFYAPSSTVKEILDEVRNASYFYCIDPWEEQDLQGIEPNLFGMHEHQDNAMLSIIF
jgi:hypothetical protein